MQVAGGKLKLYVYHHGMGAKYGDDMGIGTFGQLKRGEWQELTVRVVANQNGKSNGIMQVWLDGVLVASVQNIEARNSASPQEIGGIALNTFMGGADKRFAPDRNQFMWMDDIHFWQYSSKYLASNPSVARGLKLHPASHRLYTPISGSSSSNASPTVSLTSPKSEGQFAVGSSVSLGASASDSDGKIAKVEFYQGNTLLGTDTSSPYSYTWGKVKAGEYNLTARATDNKGATTVSEVVKIQVGSSSQTDKNESVSSKPGLGVGSGLLEGLVSFYEMNSNASGVLRDSHGSNHGKSTSIGHVNGFTEKGNRYDGSSSISRAPHSSSLALTSEFTLMADVYREGPGQASGSVIVGKTLSATWAEAEVYSIAITSDNKIRIRSHIGGLKEWVSRQTVPQGKWVRVIASYKSGEGYTLYLDTASPEKSGKMSGTLYKSTQGLTIGGSQAGNRRKVEGILDNVGIWNRQLSPAEAESLIRTKATYPDFAGGANSSPTVSLTSPKSDGQFAVGSSVSLGASASDSDGKIAKVEFYQGNTLLGTDTSSPYSYTWGKVKAGEYNLTARATDNKGATTVSEVVKIQVGSSSQTDKNESVSSKPGLGVGSGLLEGLVSFYEMNSNASGVLRDSHGSNHGKSTSIGHVNGFTEKGNRYDGSSSISRAPHSSSLALTSEFTLMADVYREGPGQASGSVIVGKTLSATWAEAEVYSIAITSDNKIRIRSHIGGLKEWVSRQTVPQGKWVRVIASYKSGEGYTLYLDTASPEKSGKMSGTLYKSTQGLTIGGSQAGNRRKVEGILDNVGIWNRQLSPAEAESLIRTKATYPDFAGGATYRVTVTEATDQEAEEAGSSTSIETEAGEKLVFFVEDEQQGAAEFDYWSVDDVPVSDQALFELDMPEKDVTLTKHFKTFEAPEVRIVLPDGESEFEALSSVHVGFEVEEGDGDLAKVELYDGEELVGELGDESTGLDLDNLSEGTHELVAKLTDTDGNTYLSDPVVLKAVSARSRDLPSVLLDYAIGPNPAVDRLNILFTNLDGVYDFQIHVVSMSGSVEKTLSIRPEGSRVTIDVSDLTNGVYLLQLSANGNPVTSKKFIKL